MSKMGWTQGSGLGKDGQGSSSFVRAHSHKDTRGIGCKTSTTDETWIAATAVFNDVLKRLNETKDDATDPASADFYLLGIAV